MAPRSMPSLTSDLSYSFLAQGVGIIQEFFGWWIWILAGVVLFLLPGWALLSAFWPTWPDRNWVEILGLGFGTGLALTPVWLLFANLIHFKHGAWFVPLPGIIAAIYLIWKKAASIRRRRISHNHIDNPMRLTKTRGWRISEIGLGATILLLIFSRFWVIRGIDVPLYGDSLQHSVMTQLILRSQGLFSSWEPYAPYQSLTVHFGFPAQAAFLAWLTGIPAHQAALITGQLINILAVITILPLSYRLSKDNHWAASFTLLLAGLLSLMPAFYVNWGRYAQLAGQAILPVGIWLTWDLLERTRDQFSSHGSVDDATTATIIQPIWKAVLRSKEYWLPCLILGAVVAGMILSYYRSAFYLITFIPGLLTAWIINHKHREPRQWLAIAFVGILLCAAVIIFLLPWLPRQIDSSLSGKLVSGITDSPPTLKFILETPAWHETTAYFPALMAIASILAFSYSIIRQQWEVAAVGFWVICLLLYYLGRIIHLPGANMLQVFGIQIWLYLPASLLCGWFGEVIAKWILDRSPNAGSVGLLAFLLFAGVYGAFQVSQIIRPYEYQMVTRPDLHAMDWIRQNIPEDAVFLIEGSRVDAGRSVVGTDAGWWISLLAGRKNTIPPQYALLNETPNLSDQSERTIGLFKALEDRPLYEPESLSRLCDEGITHIYIGQREGSVGAVTQPLFLQTKC